MLNLLVVLMDLALLGDWVVGMAHGHFVLHAVCSACSFIVNGNFILFFWVNGNFIFYFSG